MPLPKKSESSEVLIVGAGPTGLIMAIELARHDIPFRIVDKEDQPAETSRALALQSRTLEILYSMDVLGKVLAKKQAVAVLGGYINDRPRVLLNFMRGSKSPYPYICILSQAETEQILTEHLQSLGHKIERGTSVEQLVQTDKGVTVTLKTKGKKSTMHPNWVVGCDGAHSVVRHALDLPFKGSTYEEEFMLADVKVDWKLPPQTAQLFLKQEGVLVAIPMASGFTRLVTMADAAADKQPTLQQFQERVNYFYPGDATLSDPKWLTSFKLHRRMVPKMRVGRVFLAGDAAHIHSPIGGQGMNTGIQDAHNLAWKLAAHIQGKVREEFLDSYNDERLPVAKHVLQGTNAAMRALLVTQPWLQKVRDGIAPILLKLPIVQSHLQSMISETNVNYRSSPVVSHELDTVEQLRNWAKTCFQGGVQAGNRAIDAPLLEPKSCTKTRLYNLIKDTDHTLLLFVGEQPELIKADSDLIKKLSKEFSRVLKGYLIVAEHSIDYNLMNGKLYNTFIDNNGVGHNRFGCIKSTLLLIRPDGYCAFRGDVEDVNSLRYYLNHHFLL